MSTVETAINEPSRTAYLVRENPHSMGVTIDAPTSPIGVLPGIFPENLGDSSMHDAHGVRYAYIAGEMANGIATAQMVEAICREGMLGFFGAAGLGLAEIEKNLVRLEESCAGLAWGSNLIHSPQDQELEEKTVDLYLAHGVKRVSASAFMGVRPSVVRYSYTGIHKAADGSVVRPNHVFAKISRPEVARQFLSPAPEAMLQALVEKGGLTCAEAELARTLPVAEDFTVEADSGGHTDNRPLVALLPTIMNVRDEIAAKYNYTRPIRVGCGGGLGTPSAVAAAFSLGAAYVMIGSVNQCTRESGQCDHAKKLLSQAGLADVMMAPAGDMFELGVKVQVLKRGTLFGMRATKLWELYNRHESLETMPATVIQQLEKDIFKKPLAQVWEDTRQYFLQRKPEEADRGAKDPKHRMALVFRWYLGQSSRWSIGGDKTRVMDYQIWCGPAMGAFNEWAAGSFLEDPANRGVGEIALNLMHGAASITRAQQLRASGVNVPSRMFHYPPRPLTANFGRAAHAN